MNKTTIIATLGILASMSMSNADSMSVSERVRILQNQSQSNANSHKGRGIDGMDLFKTYYAQYDTNSATKNNLIENRMNIISQLNDALKSIPRTHNMNILMSNKKIKDIFNQYKS
jgi:hypothetical protein